MSRQQPFVCDRSDIGKFVRLVGWLNGQSTLNDLVRQGVARQHTENHDNVEYVGQEMIHAPLKIQAMLAAWGSSGRRAVRRRLVRISRPAPWPPPFRGSVARPCPSPKRSVWATYLVGIFSLGSR